MQFDSSGLVKCILTRQARFSVLTPQASFSAVWFVGLGSVQFVSSGSVQCSLTRQARFSAV